MYVRMRCVLVCMFLCTMYVRTYVFDGYLFTSVYVHMCVHYMMDVCTYFEADVMVPQHVIMYR
jgi:hypothetical protein